MAANIDIQEVLSGYNTEIGTLTQRALVAEASVKALERSIVQLTADNEQLRSDLSSQLEINAQLNGDKDAPQLAEGGVVQEIPETFKGGKAQK